MKLILMFVMFTAMTLPIVAQDRPLTATSPLPPPLKASVEFSEKLPSLDPLLWEGNYFDEKAATALLKYEATNTSFWKKIAAWQAGNWEYTQSTNTKAVKYFNGQPRPNKTIIGVYTVKSRGTIGWQRDKNGDIWEWYHSGYWTNTDCGNYVTHAFIKLSVPGAGEYPDKYAELIRFTVDKSTNKIIEVQQRRSFERYIYLNPKLMKAEQAYTTYGKNGQPDHTVWSSALNRRIATFDENENKWFKEPNYQNMRQDFFSYLKNNGMANLIPTDNSRANVSIKDSATVENYGSPVTFK